MNTTTPRVRPIPDAIIRRATEYKLAATLAVRGAKCTAASHNAWLACIDAATLRGLAKRLDTYNEARCNRPVSNREDNAATNARLRVCKIVEGYGATAHFGGDPRGPAVRLYWPDMIPAGKEPDAYTDRMLVVEI